MSNIDQEIARTGAFTAVPAPSSVADARTIPAETNAGSAAAAPNPHYKPYLLLAAWRGIASLAVVFFHSCASADSAAQAQILGAAWYKLGLYGYLGVQVFFVVSGYCIANAAAVCLRRQDSLGSYVSARVKRIYPPYLATVALTLAAGVVSAHLVRSGALAHSKVGGENPLAHTALWYLSTVTLSERVFRQANLVVQAWTLNYEVAFYVVVGACLAALSRLRSEVKLLLGLHAVTIAALVWLLAAPRTVIYPFDLWPQFGIGAVVYDLLANRRQTRSVAAFGIIALLCAAVALRPAHDPNLRVQFAAVTVFALALAALYKFDLGLSRQKLSKALAVIGTISYSLYLTHELVIGLVLQLSRKLHSHLLQSYLVSTIIQLLCALIFAACFFYVCERPFISRKQKQIAKVTA